MYSFKKVIALAVILTMVFSFSTSVNAASDIVVKVDGQALTLDVAPIIENGRTLVPIRFIAEALGAQVVWDPIYRSVYIDTVDNSVTLKIDSTDAKLNGEAKTLDVPARIVEGRTLIPLRFVSESLGAEVDWIDSSRTVTVDYFTQMSGTLKIGGSTTVQPISDAVVIALKKLNSGLSVDIAGGGSGAGVKGAASGEFNIGNASRAVKSSEKNDYPDLKDFKIGSDGIAVVVNKKNPVKALTRQQIYDIFTGKITNWKDVGGNDEAIFVQTREPGSGTLGAFEELAIQTVNKEGKITDTATPHSSNGLMKQEITKTENAIGFLSFGYLDGSTTAVSVDGVEATVENAMEGTWPLVRPLVCMTKGTPSGVAAKFLNYLYSPEGQKILEDEGFLVSRKYNK